MFGDPWIWQQGVRVVQEASWRCVTGGTAGQHEKKMVLAGSSTAWGERAALDTMCVCFDGLSAYHTGPKPTCLGSTSVLALLLSGETRGRLCVRPFLSGFFGSRTRSRVRAEDRKSEIGWISRVFRTRDKKNAAGHPRDVQTPRGLCVATGGLCWMSMRLQSARLDAWGAAVIERRPHLRLCCTWPRLAQGPNPNY